MTAATTAAIVLAGGRSTRMGRPKADLEWHGSTLLRRAAGIAGRAVDGPVVVVRAPGQALPELAAGTEIAEDATAGRGPLAGLAAGLQALGEGTEVVYVTGVDAPFLHPAFVRRVLALLGPRHDVALPHAHGFPQPLAAAYRVATVAPALRALLAEDPQPGSRALLRRCRVAELDEATLLGDPGVAALDPALDSLRNVNDPAAYEDARRRPAPAITVSVDGGAARPHAAATLLAAIRAAGCGLDGVAATVDGRATGEPQEPLVAGDRVALRTRPARHGGPRRGQA
ncbi:MAG: molybdenum cofactor guanylyltransferase [Solirubrobacteraceae bacterium]|nr:molybdenum cofactor guanylyltransferase [Solirubrobacteraceae bacterium]